MNNEIKSEKYRKLSVAALVTGILVVSCMILSISTISLAVDDNNVYKPIKIIWDIFSYVTLGISIAAITCGSIDLQRVQAGRYTNKGRGFDITGIVIGVIFILTFLLTD